MHVFIYASLIRVLSWQIEISAKRIWIRISNTSMHVSDRRNFDTGRGFADLCFCQILLDLEFPNVSMHVLSTCAFDTRQESAGKNNFRKTFPDRAFPNTSTHVLTYAILLKWVLADQYFRQILLDREPPNVPMRVLVYADSRIFRQTYLDQNFQFFNACFDICNSDTRRDLADQYFCQVVLDQEFPKVSMRVLNMHFWYEVWIGRSKTKFLAKHI